MPQHPDYGASGDKKTLNTHLHLLESFTNLYEASKDAAVRSRLVELMSLCANAAIDTKRECAFQFFERDWTPLPSPASYGHDIQLSWLLTKAVDVGEISNASPIHELSLMLARGVARDGLDPENGGVLYESDEGGRRTGKREKWPIRCLPAFVRPYVDLWRSRDRKVWWVQAEALVGFLNAYALSGDERFIDAFSSVEKWVCARQVDREYGEWHREVPSWGRPRGDKGSLWKTPYHTARACIEVVQRLKRLRR
jgi:mannobiose 2-epimerase